MSTGDSVQADQSTKWDFLKRQTVTLTLNLDDILKDGNHPLLNACNFSVSGRMAFAHKNCKTSQMDSAVEDLNVEDSGSTTQPLQLQSIDPGKQEIANFINRSRTTLHEASGLLVECAEKLKEQRLMTHLSTRRNEIKDTTRTVIDMLNKLSGNTGTGNSDNDDDDKPPSDDEDSDGSHKTFRGPKGEDTSEEPKHPPNYPPENPSKNNEDSTGGCKPTKSANEQQSEKTESRLVETTTTDIDNPTDSSRGLPLPASTQDPENQEPVETDPKDSSAVETSVASSLVPDVDESGDGEEHPLASELDKEEKYKKHKDESGEQKVDNKLAGSSEDIPVTQTLPQQEADLPQEHPALEDAPISETTPLVKEKEQESRDSEPNPPASGVDKKKGDFEKASDAGLGLGSQPTTDLPQEHSAPAESEIGKAGSDNKADESGVAPAPDPVEKQLSRKEKKKLERKAKQEAERTSKKHSASAEPVIEQIPKDNQAGNSGNDAVPESNIVQHDRTSNEPEQTQNKKAQGDKNVKVEEDDSPISMDVMLLQYFVAMRDVRDKNMEPRRVQLSGLLGEISVFYRSDDFETYAAIDPNDLFRKVLGSEWIEERGVASDICRQLVYFYKTPAKRYATDIIAYLHYNFGISTYPDDEKVLSMKQLFVKFNEELFSWITSQWLKRAIRYGKHRLVEIEDKSSIYAWRDKPADYRENPNVENRISYYKTHTETFEDRLISSCYKYLTSQHENLKKYHDILDFDLDYVCATPPVPNENKELLFFSNIFDFDRDLLKTMFYEKCADNKDNELPSQEAPAPPTDTGKEKHKNKDDKSTEDVQQQEFLSSVTLPILFSTMKFIREKNVKLENFKFNENLEKIIMFHTTREWKNNYKNNSQFTPEAVLTKLFGSPEKIQTKKDMESRFCRLVSANLRTQGLSSFAVELVAFMDQSYSNKTLETPGNDATTTKQSFTREFTFMVNEACEKWINSQFKTSLDDYFKYHDNRKTNLLKCSKDTEKYSWRPRPPSYQDSLLPRTDFHVEKARSAKKCYVSLTIVTFYRYMIKIHKLNDYLNDALEFIFTRPEESMRAAELKFFVSLFGLKKWSPWYSNNLLELLK